MFEGASGLMRKERGFKQLAVKRKRSGSESGISCVNYSDSAVTPFFQVFLWKNMKDGG
jgi:hypothetical protein